ncbi:hypothetical protein KYE_10359 [Marinobacter manganoxydans MnI7-9]|uniref:Uncharacterized protein n=1 Tax=Marinobacter manganoxydans MnI7-9 TaxID=1094979 RepID=G6YT80_9GAMM|nr:hypothetical protein KYE_10359 [Marinobacter manganoxydans MnI7-9]
MGGNLQRFTHRPAQKASPPHLTSFGLEILETLLHWHYFRNQIVILCLHTTCSLEDQMLILLSGFLDWSRFFLSPQCFSRSRNKGLLE